MAMKKIVIYFLFLILAAPLFAQEQQVDSLLETSGSEEMFTPASVDELWDLANTAYINADYKKAIKVYNQIREQGFSSMKLYYNLGNAHFKENQLAEAILFYNRALRISPGNGDIRYNLEIAEEATKDNIESVPKFFVANWFLYIRSLMGCTAWGLISLLAFAMMFIMTILYLLSQRLVVRKIGFFGMLFMLLIFIMSTIFAVKVGCEIADSRNAIVMSSSISVKSSPDRSATDMFVLHEGTKVTITNTLNEWCEIVIADGKKGWAESRTIEAI